MGLKSLPQYILYWHQNDITGNSGMKKKTMTCRSYQKLTQYLHVSDRANEPILNNADYDKMYKIFPVLNMVQDSFAESYKPEQNQKIDEEMIAFQGRLSYVQYLSAKSIKRGIKLWMYYDADTVYLHLFEVYLGPQQNSEFGLRCDVKMKPYKYISGKITISIVTTVYICPVIERLAGL